FLWRAAVLLLSADAMPASTNTERIVVVVGRNSVAHSADQAGEGLSAQHALRLDIEGIDRLARRHEQPVALPAAKTDIGAALGQQDAPDQGAVRCEHCDPVLALAAGEAAPDIAVGVDPDAVGIARYGVEEEAAVHRAGAVIDDVIDMHGLVAARRVDDVQ